MVFDEMLKKMKEGVEIPLENVEITEEFLRKYEEYQQSVKTEENSEEIDQ